MFGNKKKEIEATLKTELEKAVKELNAEAERIRKENHKSELRVKKMVDEFSSMKDAVIETMEILRKEQPEIGKVIDLTERLDALSMKVDELETMIHNAPATSNTGFIPPAESEYGELHFM